MKFVGMIPEVENGDGVKKMYCYGRLLDCLLSRAKSLRQFFLFDTNNCQIAAFIRRQLRMMQSVVHCKGGDVSRYSGTFLLLDSLD